jgi:hypothetical protein
VGSVVANVTVVDPSHKGYLTVFPQGVARPYASTLNWEAGQTVANPIMMPLGGAGQISLYVAEMPFTTDASVHLVVDVVGWYPSDGVPAGNALTLRSDGLGSTGFGATLAAVELIVQSVLGSALTTTTESFLATEPGGRFYNDQSRNTFAYRYSRQSCYTDTSA